MNPLKLMLKRAQEDWNEIGDTLLGNHSQRILDDEIRNVDAALRDLRNEALNARASLFTSDERRQALLLSIAEREDQASKALRQRRKALARDIATLIAGLERDLSETDEKIARIQSHIDRLQHLIQQGEGKLRRLKHQLDTIRVSESLQRAQEAVGERRGGIGPSSPRSALDLLTRARSASDREGNPSPRNEYDHGESTLDARLREAGIIDDQEQAGAVLARLEQRIKASASSLASTTTRPARPKPGRPKQP